MSTPASATPGTVIAGRYEVQRLIARGGMAAVYLAQQTNLRRNVALKILTAPQDPEDSQAFEDRFRLEAETLASLDHPHIVTLYDYGELERPLEVMNQGRFYLAMEYVEGPRLADLLKNGPLEPQHALRLMSQVARALRYAHRRGVVHRDLKPSNLLVKTTDGEELVKVVDFGLVKLTDDDQSITRAGMILGSPHCMAPEQIRGIDIDHRADIYALGILLFRCIVGRYPFHGANGTATMVAHLNEPVPSMADVANLPEGLEAVVHACLQKEANQRFGSMEELYDALCSMLTGPIDEGPTSQSVSMSPSGTMSQSAAIASLLDDTVTEPTIDASAVTVSQWAGAGILGAALLLAGTIILGGAVLALGLAATQHLAPGQIEAVAPAEAQPRPVEEPLPGTKNTAPEPDGPEAEVVAPDVPNPKAKPAESVKPQPKPAPKPAAAPAQKPAPSRPKPTPNPAETPPPTEPTPAEPDPPATPEGYLGLPDDLFNTP